MCEAAASGSNVVGLALAGNNLVGALPDDAGAAAALLLLNSNGLVGAIPSWTLSVGSELRLGGNGFDYRESDATLHALFRRCRLEPDVTCDEVPPGTCDAFGGELAVSLDDPSHCVSCNDLSGTIAATVVVILVSLLVLVGYVRMIQRDPTALRKYVTTISILVAHMQTVSILTTLQLD